MFESMAMFHATGQLSFQLLGLLMAMAYAAVIALALITKRK